MGGRGVKGKGAISCVSSNTDGQGAFSKEWLKVEGIPSPLPPFLLEVVIRRRGHKDPGLSLPRCAWVKAH